MCTCISKTITDDICLDSPIRTVIGYSCVYFVLLTATFFQLNNFIDNCLKYRNNKQIFLNVLHFKLIKK